VGQFSISANTQGLLADLRDQYGWMESGKSTLILDADGNAIWWNFAGKLLNSAMKDLLADEADKLFADNECMTFRHVYSAEALVRAIREILAGDAHNLAVLLDEAFVQELKFAECLSQKEIDRELGERYSVDSDFKQFSRVSLAVLWVKEEA